MQIWLKQGKEKLRLPVLPPDFEASLSQQNTTVNVNSLGEVNILGKRKLKTLPLSSFFPNHQYNFAQYTDYPGPYECVRLIVSWMDNPIQVTITGTDINMQATIETFTYKEQDGTGDVYFTIELKEYRKPSLSATKKSTVNKTSTMIQIANTKRASKTVKTSNYVVMQNDSLWDIAKRITGDGGNCYAIANQNNIKKPYILTTGQKLVIKI